MRPGILLDRDGVINQNRADHVRTWAEFEFLPGALEALRRLAQLNLPIAVVTNQSIIGRQLVTRAVVEDINRRMVAEVKAAGGRLDGVWYCPHVHEDGCLCRKHAPGLLFAAAAELDISLRDSFLVGDALSDMQAAMAVGAAAIMVRTGRGTVLLQAPACLTLPRFAVVEDLLEAADRIRVSLKA